MAEYKLIANWDGVIRVADNVSIPNDIDNADWRKYLKWLSDGNKPDPVDMSVRRAFVMDKLVAKRNAVIQSGVVVNQNPFFTDDASIALVHQAITMEGLGIQAVFPRSWILANGSVIEVSYDDMKAVAIAIAEKKDACYANYMALAAEINASDDPESIDIDAGWPN